MQDFNDTCMYIYTLYSGIQFTPNSLHEAAFYPENQEKKVGFHEQ
jgi:hypothetical protein